MATRERGVVLGLIGTVLLCLLAPAGLLWCDQGRRVLTTLGSTGFCTRFPMDLLGKRVFPGAALDYGVLPQAEGVIKAKSHWDLP